MEQKKIKKLYYSISEVSQITSVKKYVLRYWETEFPELRPGKNRAGNRIYRLNDIKTVFLIKKLLYQDKYTIEGAKKKLKELKKQKDPQLELSFDALRKDDVLMELKKDLRALLDFLDHKGPDLSRAEEKEADGPAAEEQDEQPEQREVEGAREESEPQVFQAAHDTKPAANHAEPAMLDFSEPQDPEPPDASSEESKQHDDEYPL